MKIGGALCYTVVHKEVLIKRKRWKDVSIFLQIKLEYTMIPHFYGMIVPIAGKFTSVHSDIVLSSASAEGVIML